MTTTSNSRLIHITDARRKLLLPKDDCTEPEPGSIVLVKGIYGTAWQRFFSDGLWHSVRGGRPRTWEEILTEDRVVLVYDAEPRDTGEESES